MLQNKLRIKSGTLLPALAAILVAGPVAAHHSFAMYDTSQTLVITGIVTRIDPNPNHLQIFIAPLNAARDQVLKDDKDEPIVWAIEMDSAAREAQEGITVNGIPRGSIVSVGLHPLRNGFPGGGRGESGFYVCPTDTPPEPGQHCDSVPGATSHGKGVIPVAEEVGAVSAP